MRIPKILTDISAKELQMYRQINNYRPILDVILNRLVDCADAKLIWYGKERCLSTIATALFYHNKPLNYVIDDNPALWGVSCGHFLTIFPVDQIVNKYGKSAIFFISSEDAETKISRLKSYGIEDNSIVLLPTEKESIKLVTDELLAPLQGKGYVELTHREMQLAMVENLKAFDSFCKPRGLRYFLASGTLLGAFRHKGFIPWDDDADVHFKRDEYEQFCIACQKHLNTDLFYFQDYKETPGYRWGYGKLRRKGSRFVRSDQEHMPYEQGIFIDIFIDDYVPDNYILRCICAIKCFMFRKAFWSAVGKHSATGIERFLYFLLSLIPEKYLKDLYSQFERKHRKKTGWVRSLTFPTPTKDYGYPSCWWDTFGEIEFEGNAMMTFDKIHEYLTFKYGDYMIIPPECQRKTHPISALKLPE